jgi:endonuclease/exonuclease/phosphatase (EEP) superfamily protein YafD
LRARLTCIASLLLTLVLLVTSLRYAVEFWLLAFVYSFQLHIGLACMIASVVCIVVLRSRYAILLLVWSMAIATHAFVMTRDFRTEAALQPDAQPFRVMSFNILMENARNAGFIADAIIKSNADVVYVMEAEALQPTLQRVLRTYPYRLGCHEGTFTCDLMILSRYPLINGRFYSLSDLRQDRFAMASVNVEGTEINLAAIHLTKPYFDDYHSYELTEATELLWKVSGPLILGGDFNSSSIAPDMRAFMRYNDFHKATWEPATWPIEAGRFGIAIDHIYARKPAILSKLERLPDNLGSNHYGLVADFMIGK